MTEIKDYEQIAARLGELHKEVRRIQTKMLESHGVSLLEYHIIAIIQKSGQVSQNEIADALGVNKALISRQIQSMEKKKFLHRDSDPSCRRRNLLSLSPKALEIIPMLKEAHQSSLQDFFSDLDDGQVEELNNILGGLISKL